MTTKSASRKTKETGEKRREDDTHAEALSTTPCFVIFPGTLLEVRSEGLTETSSRRMWY